uniref:C2 NT-type domain-containing protein n=1 Tax=Chromera velia CCMP2878 TaxID=1169474 RepID=A0A0G4IA39_9ALVE|eukprot:Cvel_12354.t1-p1 / transcript=Cvel_12354.t1 / gene=Cvel_12354 / organism=Chromera_velia_CCMP2878 / gene_product=hypothetical protein / transcript_product=hypothetical protein / location=Cvel_scaffold804:22515-29254(+) / protein_length=624 / sequence_SO=supercontig / SO=protein_coding / is_pseudo=false
MGNADSRFGEDGGMPSKFKCALLLNDVRNCPLAANEYCRITAYINNEDGQLTRQTATKTKHAYVTLSFDSVIQVFVHSVIDDHSGSDRNHKTSKLLGSLYLPIQDIFNTHGFYFYHSWIVMSPAEGSTEPVTDLNVPHNEHVRREMVNRFFNAVWEAPRMPKAAMACVSIFPDHDYDPHTNTFAPAKRQEFYGHRWTSMLQSHAQHLYLCQSQNLLLSADDSLPSLGRKLFKQKEKTKMYKEQNRALEKRVGLLKAEVSRYENTILNLATNAESESNQKSKLASMETELTVARGKADSLEARCAEAEYYRSKQNETLESLKKELEQKNEQYIAKAHQFDSLHEFCAKNSLDANRVIESQTKELKAKGDRQSTIEAELRDAKVELGEERRTTERLRQATGSLEMELTSLSTRCQRLEEENRMLLAAQEAREANQQSDADHSRVFRGRPCSRGQLPHPSVTEPRKYFKDLERETAGDSGWSPADVERYFNDLVDDVNNMAKQRDDVITLLNEQNVWIKYTMEEKQKADEDGYAEEMPLQERAQEFLEDQAARLGDLYGSGLEEHCQALNLHSIVDTLRGTKQREREREKERERRRGGTGETEVPDTVPETMSHRSVFPSRPLHFYD